MHTLDRFRASANKAFLIFASMVYELPPLIINYCKLECIFGLWFQFYICKRKFSGIWKPVYSNSQLVFPVNERHWKLHKGGNNVVRVVHAREVNLLRNREPQIICSFPVLISRCSGNIQLLCLATITHRLHISCVLSKSTNDAVISLLSVINFDTNALARKIQRTICLRCTFKGFKSTSCLISLIKCVVQI
jgi:hypothetical protein